jgi:cell division protein FtsA
MEKYIVAIDLGTKRITALAGKQTSSGKFHVLAHHEIASRGIECGEIVNEVEVGNVLKTLLAELKPQLADIDITEVYVGVSGEHIRCTKESEEKTRNNPNVGISESEIHHLRKEVCNRVKSEHKALDVIPQVYRLDNGRSLTNPVGVRSHRLEAEFCVLTAANSSMELLASSIRQAGLQLKGSFLSPLAAAEAVLHDDEKEIGVVLVDIGGGTAGVVVYYDKIVRHVAVIPFGSEVITDDIRKGCAIPQRYAEQLKEQYGSCYSDLIRENPTYRIPSISGGEVSHRMLTRIIEARVEEIIEAVEHEIERSGYASQLGAGIVLTGGGAKLGDLTEFVTYKTGMKARKGEPQLVTSDSDAEVQHGDYATAVGLLMKGATCKEDIKTELFDPDTVKIKTPEKVKTKTKREREKPEEREKKPNRMKDIFEFWFRTTDNET